MTNIGNDKRMIPEGTLLMLYSLRDGKRLFLTLEAGRQFSTLHGQLHHDEIARMGFGEKVSSHLGVEFLILRPTLYELIMHVPRSTQIVYPKDAGYILMKLGLRNGDRMIEAGTGSGALTIAFAYSVGPEGRVSTYEKRIDLLNKAIRNLELAGIRDYVETNNEDVEIEPFKEEGVDAVFFDIREPDGSLIHAHRSLRRGGTIGFILPTMNQVIQVVGRIEAIGFVDVEVTELMIRHYKTTPERMRPNDRMVGHTGYLVFARKALTESVNEGSL